MNVEAMARVEPQRHRKKKWLYQSLCMDVRIERAEMNVLGSVSVCTLHGLQQAKK